MGSLTVRLGHADIVLIRVVVRAVDHDRVDGHAVVLSKVKDSRNVLVGSGVVDVHRDWYARGVARLNYEANKVNTELSGRFGQLPE